MVRSYYYIYFRCKNSVLQIDHFLNSEKNKLKYFIQSVRNIDSAPTVRATYLLEKQLEERIIATYFLLPQQPIYLLLLLRQPISKSYSRCPSLLSLGSTGDGRLLIHLYYSAVTGNRKQVLTGSSESCEHKCR